MRAIIDIVLILIIALCTWNGYKKGLVGGIAGILAIIIALFGGSLLASAYSHEIVPAVEPFVDGYVDSSKNRDAILDRMGYGSSDLSLEDILAQDSSLRYDYAYECFTAMGLYEKRAEELAGDAVSLADTDGVTMTKAVVSVLPRCLLACLSTPRETASMSPVFLCRRRPVATIRWTMWSVSLPKRIALIMVFPSAF